MVKRLDHNKVNKQKAKKENAKKSVGVPDSVSSHVTLARAGSTDRRTVRHARLLINAIRENKRGIVEDKIAARFADYMKEFAWKD